MSKKVTNTPKQDSTDEAYENNPAYPYYSNDLSQKYNYTQDYYTDYAQQRYSYNYNQNYQDYSYNVYPKIKKNFELECKNEESDSNESRMRMAGKKKMCLEYIEPKNRRSVTFSKRKKGIMKKAYELSVLTGSQILLLVASESGHVYTFATPKLKPIITDHEQLIQQCLNNPHEEYPDVYRHKKVNQPDANYDRQSNFENTFEDFFELNKK